MKIVLEKPEWGQALQPGYCGFITREQDFVDDGIEYFEHFETGLPFVHTFVIEGLAPPAGIQDLKSQISNLKSSGAAADQSQIKIQNSKIQIIEAHAQTGVHRATLDEYLGQKDVQCFIRMPIGRTPEIGAKTVAAAATHIGEKYGFGLIVADALANTFVGHCVNKLTLNAPDKFMCWLLDNQHAKICSQLVALALQSQFYLRLRGCLRRPADTILPKELGNDPQIWDPVIYRIN